MRMTARMIWMLSMLGVLFAGFAPGATVLASVDVWHVSVAGRDDADGRSPETAWASFARANGALGPGDTLVVHPGVYTERVRITASGTPDMPITIRASVPRAAIVDGKAIDVPLDNWDGLFELFEVSHVTLEGLTVQNSSYIGIVVVGPGSEGVTVRDCFTDNTASSGIAAWGLIDDGWGVRDLLIENNEVARANMSSWHENITLTWGVHGFVVRGNLVRDGGFGNAATEVVPEGIDAKFGVANGLIQGNVVRDINRGNGIYIDAWDAYAQDILIDANIIDRASDFGIAIGAERGGTVDRITVSNNVVRWSGDDGIIVSGYGEPLGPKHDILIVNNTFFGCGTRRGGGIWLEDETATDVRIINNIFSANNQYQIAVINPELATHVISHNLIDGFRDFLYTEPGVVFVETLGTNAALGAALLLDPATDPRPSSSSPAFNSADPAWAPQQDLVGRSRRCNGAPDMGALEGRCVPAVPGPNSVLPSRDPESRSVRPSMPQPGA